MMDQERKATEALSTRTNGWRFPFPFLVILYVYKCVCVCVVATHKWKWNSNVVFPQRARIKSHKCHPVNSPVIHIQIQCDIHIHIHIQILRQLRPLFEVGRTFTFHVPFAPDVLVFKIAVEAIKRSVRLTYPVFRSYIRLMSWAST